MEAEEIEMITDKEELTEKELDMGLRILEEAQKIQDNPELMKNIEEYGKKKAETYRSISQLRQKANEMALNPGQYASQEDIAREKKEKRLAKKS